MRQKLQKRCKCMINMMQKVLTSVALLALSCAALAVPAIPSDLNGRKIQFSYPTSWKFTPLLIHFGEAEAGSQNTYAVHGEDRSCEVIYQPDVAAGIAELRVNGKRDKAFIRMRYITEVSGTAYMKWNGADYYHLNFRLEDDADRRAYLCRMGDPVGDVMPRSLAGKVLEIDFSGAFGGEINLETGRLDHREWSSAPWVVKFPQSNEGGTAELPGAEKAVAADYEPMGCGAMVSLKGQGLNGQITLDFASSDSGLARVDWEKDAADSIVWSARFTIRPMRAAAGQGTDDALQTLISSLEKAEYKTAVERLYQKRLLTLLAQMEQGASVDTMLPHANGTTALHNACGLSHVEIVQWLVEHGADLNARTAGGASVDDCVGGPNARAIRAILRKARNSK